jgi:hypothetical protein
MERQPNNLERILTAAFVALMVFCAVYLAYSVLGAVVGGKGKAPKETIQEEPTGGGGGEY